MTTLTAIITTKDVEDAGFREEFFDDVLDHMANFYESRGFEVLAVPYADDEDDVCEELRQQCYVHVFNEMGRW